MTHSRNSTAVQRQCYNNRAMSTHNAHAGGHNFIIRKNGQLFAQISRNQADGVLYRSTDNGFSWVACSVDRFTVGNTRVPNDQFCKGPVNAISIFESYNQIVMWMATYQSVGTSYEVIHSVAELDSDLTDNGSWSDYNIADLGSNEVESAMFSVCNTERYAYMIYRDSADDLNIRRYDPLTANAIGSSTQETANNWGTTFDCIVNEDSEVDILGVVVNGSSVEEVSHVRYTDSGGYGTVTTIDTCPSSSEKIVDLAIAMDGLGTLCAVWGEKNGADTDVSLRYATSTDDGATWDQTDLGKQSGNGAFIDAAFSTPATRTDVIGGQDGGFLITNTEDNGSNIPKSYVRELTTSDGGTTYTLQDAALVANEDDAEIVAGAKFFRPAGAGILHLEYPGRIRMAYQIHEGDATDQDDETPVDIDQELLLHSAYPTELATEAGSYSTDPYADGDLRFEVEVIAGPTENHDHYAAGMTGRYTERFIAAFEKVATQHRLLQYEPHDDSLLGDRTAYEEPVEHCVKIIWEPISYAEPAPDLSTSETTDYIETDVRKIYLSPEKFLSRDFILNHGNFLKRTVWTTFYHGNEYEITQIVPHFIKNQICYYEANAYVIGPSRDPFTRTVLPSET